MTTLEVWLYGKLIGHITQTRRGGVFCYTSEIAGKYSSRPLLSMCMPVKSRPFGEEKTANWFEGLLPEGDRRDAIASEFGLSRYDWFGLLAEIGWECAGAVQVVPEGAMVGAENSYQPIGADELAAQLAALPHRRPEIKHETFRMSLDGFQNKITMARPAFSEREKREGYITAEGMLLPLGNAPSTHILKVEDSENYPGSAESEAWAMTAASLAARCSKVALLDLEGAPATLVIERYDRIRSEQEPYIERLHQEDACQALGLFPKNKYAISRILKGDEPSYKRIAELLVLYSKRCEDEYAELLRQMTVNYVLGNRDAHAKNVSFLYLKPMSPVLAPLYDVLPITEVEPKTGELALHIDGSINPGDVSRSALINEASSWGMDDEEAARIIDRCCEDIAKGLEIARERFGAAAEKHEPRTRERLALIAEGKAESQIRKPVERTVQRKVEAGLMTEMQPRRGSERDAGRFGLRI